MGKIENKIWICTCGAYNALYLTQCGSCNKEKIK